MFELKGSVLFCWESEIKKVNTMKTAGLVCVVLLMAVWIGCGGSGKIVGVPSVAVSEENPSDAAGENAQIRAKIESLIQAQKYDRALTLVMQQLRKTPKQPDLFAIAEELTAGIGNWECGLELCRLGTAAFPERGADWAVKEVAYLAADNAIDAAIRKFGELTARPDCQSREIREKIIPRMLGAAVLSYQINGPQGAIRLLDAVEKDPFVRPGVMRDIRALKADFLVKDERREEALPLIAQLQTEQPLNISYAVLANSADVSTNQISELERKTVEQPQDWADWVRLLVQVEKHPEAERLFDVFFAEYKKAGNRVPADLYQLYSEALALGEKREKLNRILLEGMELYPDSPFLANSLAYSYAVENRNLDEALKLVRSALKTLPGNASFIDTLGWVLFRQGKNNEALQHLLKAAELVPQNPEILDHVGDVLLATGRRDEALQFWQRIEELDQKYPGIKEKIEKYKKE